MASRLLQRLARAGVLLAAVLSVAATVADARPVRRTARPTAARGFNLFAGAVNVEMNVNRVQCNINNIGETCVDGTNSPSLPGGYWPKGSPNQYIFNGGLQLAGRVGGTDGANFPWPGDTVGAFFFDPRGDQAHGEGRTNVFNSLNADDFANWPSAAYIRDTSLFDPVLIGRRNASQQDTWVRYWDGNTNLSAGRQHPMGVLVEQRGLMWNFPSGNQDIVYFLYRFINITSVQSADYDGLVDAGYTAQDIAEIVAIAQDFQARSEAAYNVDIPDGGYTLTDLYAAFAQDPDVTASSTRNFSSANLPFAMGFAYHSEFVAPEMLYPASINSPPFAAAPGFEGVKYLKSPQNIGIRLFGNTTNSAQFADSRGVQQLWRRLSGNLLPGTDGTCSVTDPKVRRFCFIGQSPDDTRFYQSSGPFEMAPGQSAVIVVAYVHAAALGSASAQTPGVGAQIPAFNLAIGTTLAPQLPLEGGRLFTGSDVVKPIDRAIGWISHTGDLNANNAIDQEEVITAPRSLLNKGMVAQAVFDVRFLLPFAPEAPLFYLVPGSNQVTIAWQTSVSETEGDPYFVVASDVSSALYDPNFRKFDVEGYRIWRGRSQAEMEVIASFDYQGTVINDYNGSFFNADYGTQCAPELGLTTSCPAFPNPISLSGDVVQVVPGGRVETQTVDSLGRGSIIITQADTAITGGNSGIPGLVDNAVPFAYIDNSVRDGFQYYYAVTAFDVNSVKSGPSSLESPLITKTVTPRALSANAVSAVIVTGVFGGNGTELNPNASYPAIDAATGAFSGVVPPANGGLIRFLASVSEALGVGSYGVRVDSVSPGSLGGLGTPGNTIYYSLIAGADTTPLSVTPAQMSFASAPDAEIEFNFSYPLVPYDSVQSQRLGLAFTEDVRMPVEFVGQVANPSNGSAGISLQARRFGEANLASNYLSHSRWYTGTAEPADPTTSFLADSARNSGALPGIGLIYKPVSYRLPIESEAPIGTAINQRARSIDYTRTTWYPADFVITWNADSTITVRDSTHRTTLPFNAAYGTGYGFTDTLTHVGLTETELENVDNCTSAACRAAITPASGTVSYRHLYYHYPANVQRGRARRNMVAKAKIVPIDFTNDGVADRNGFALTINSETWFFATNTIPAAGTVWNLRAIGGEGMNATCTPALTSPMLVPPTDCSGYSFAPTNTIRPAYAPGLFFAIQVTQSFAVTAAAGDLNNVHTVPDPYYVTNSLENTRDNKILRFVNLPERAIVRIYSASGILVAIVNHNDPAGGGEARWNLRNRNNQFVASGVYFYHVEAADGQTKVGRFTVVNFAQ